MPFVVRFWHRTVAAPRVLLAPLAILGLGFGLACRSSSGPDWERVVGDVDPERSAAPALEVLQGGFVGEPVLVTVRTVGSSDCARPAGAEVIYREDVVEITPYDWKPVAGAGCQRDLRTYPRTVTLQFSEMGTYTLRLSGRVAFSGELASALVEIPITVAGRD